MSSEDGENKLEGFRFDPLQARPFVPRRSPNHQDSGTGRGVGRDVVFHSSGGPFGETADVYARQQRTGGGLVLSPPSDPQARIQHYLRLIVSTRNGDAEDAEQLQAVFSLTIYFASMEAHALAHACQNTLLPVDRSKLAQGINPELLLEDYRGRRPEWLKNAMVDCFVGLCRSLGTRMDLFFVWAEERLSSPSKYLERDAEKIKYILEILHKIYIQSADTSSQSLSFRAHESGPLYACTQSFLQKMPTIVRCFGAYKEVGKLEQLLSLLAQLLNAILTTIPTAFRQQFAVVANAFLQVGVQHADMDSVKAIANEFLGSKLQIWVACRSAIITDVLHALVNGLLKLQSDHPANIPLYANVWIQVACWVELGTDTELFADETERILTEFEQIFVKTEGRNKTLWRVIDDFIVHLMERMPIQQLVSTKISKFLHRLCEAASFNRNFAAVAPILDLLKKVVDAVFSVEGFDIFAHLLPFRRFCIHGKAERKKLVNILETANLHLQFDIQTVFCDELLRASDWMVVADSSPKWRPIPGDFVFIVQQIALDFRSIAAVTRFTTALLDWRSTDLYKDSGHTDGGESWDAALLSALDFAKHFQAADLTTIAFKALRDSFPTVRRKGLDLVEQLLKTEKHSSHAFLSELLSLVKLERISMNKQRCAEVLVKVVEAQPVLHPVEVSDILHFASDLLIDDREAVRKYGSVILRCLHPLDIGACPVRVGADNLREEQMSLMSQENCCEISQHDFIHVFSWMLGSRMQNDEMRLISSIYRAHQSRVEPGSPENDRLSSYQLIFWITSHLAYQCVSNRFSTVFGDWQETFATLKQSADHLLSVAQMELYTLAMMTGSALLGKPSVNAQFLKTIRKSLLTWFDNIRTTKMRIACNLSNSLQTSVLDEMILDNGMQILAKWETVSDANLEDIVNRMVDSCVRLREPETLQSIFQIVSSIPGGNEERLLTLQQISTWASREEYENIKQSTVTQIHESYTQTIATHASCWSTPSSLEEKLAKLSNWCWSSDVSTGNIRSALLITSTENQCFLPKRLLLAESLQSLPVVPTRRLPGSISICDLSLAARIYAAVGTDLLPEISIAFANSLADHECFRTVAQVLDRIKPIILEKMELSVPFALAKMDVEAKSGISVSQTMQDLLGDFPGLMRSSTFLSRIAVLSTQTSFSEALLKQLLPADAFSPTDTTTFFYRKSIEMAPQDRFSWLRLGNWAFEGEVSAENPAAAVSEAISAYLQFLEADCSEKSYDDIHAAVRVLAVSNKSPGSFSAPLLNQFKLSVNCSVWRNLIPQLFAALRNANPDICEVALQILYRVSGDRVADVLYRLLMEMDTDRAELSASAYRTRLFEYLQTDHRSVVEETSSFVRSLVSISTLVADRVLHTLTYFRVSLKKRIQELKSAKFSNDRAQFRLHFDANMVPLILAFCGSLWAIFDAPNDISTNDAEFLASYRTRLTAMLTSLEACTNDDMISIETINKSFEPVDELFHELSRLFGHTRVVALSHLNADLAAVKDSQVMIPGLLEEVFVKAIIPDVSVLGSKTKPKRLVMVGSNGRFYPFLLKGTEDLNLDERVMQILKVANTGLQNSNSSVPLSSRHYAVIPISRRVGLIQWVEKTVPFYGLFKHWQQTVGDSFDKNTMASQRPTDYWAAKIAEELKKRKVSKGLSRRQWSDDVLRSVFDELQNEAPTDLIVKELRLSSATSSEWWHRKRRMVASCATASILGHILGLGDRHLDNLLFDFDTAEVVHIDFNICFDKGKRLKIPEQVPFRLTQNLVQLCDNKPQFGLYPVVCERVLENLRTRSGATLLLLMESFLSDPLVDWLNMSPEEHAQHQSEVQSNLALLEHEFASRQHEIKRLEADMRPLSSLVHQTMVKLNLELLDRKTRTSKSSTLKKAVKECEKELQNLSFQDTDDPEARTVRERYEESRQWQQQHEKCFSCVFAQQLQAWRKETAPLLSQTAAVIQRLHDLAETLCTNISGYISQYQSLYASLRNTLLSMDYFGVVADALKPIVDGDDTLGEAAVIRRSIHNLQTWSNISSIEVQKSWIYATSTWVQRTLDVNLEKCRLYSSLGVGTPPGTFTFALSQDGALGDYHYLRAICTIGQYFTKAIQCSTERTTIEPTFVTAMSSTLRTTTGYPPFVTESMVLVNGFMAFMHAQFGHISGVNDLVDACVQFVDNCMAFKQQINAKVLPDMLDGKLEDLASEMSQMHRFWSEASQRIQICVSFLIDGEPGCGADETIKKWLDCLGPLLHQVHRYYKNAFPVIFASPFDRDATWKNYAELDETACDSVASLNEWLDGFLEEVIRDYLMKPIAKFVAKTAKRISTEILDRQPPQTHSKLERSGIAFMDSLNRVTNSLLEKNTVTQEDLESFDAALYRAMSAHCLKFVDSEVKKKIDDCSNRVRICRDLQSQLAFLEQPGNTVGIRLLESMRMDLEECSKTQAMLKQALSGDVGDSTKEVLKKDLAMLEELRVMGESILHLEMFRVPSEITSRMTADTIRILEALEKRANSRSEQAADVQERKRQLEQELASIPENESNVTDISYRVDAILTSWKTMVQKRAKVTMGKLFALLRNLGEVLVVDDEAGEKLLILVNAVRKTWKIIQNSCIEDGLAAKQVTKPKTRTIGANISTLVEQVAKKAAIFAAMENHVQSLFSNLWNLQMAMEALKSASVSNNGEFPPEEVDDVALGNRSDASQQSSTRSLSQPAEYFGAAASVNIPRKQRNIEKEEQMCLAILQSCRQKLLGNGDLPLQEEVQQLIEEATDPRNLCQMYEGWMAWV